MIKVNLGLLFFFLQEKYKDCVKKDGRKAKTTDRRGWTCYTKNTS